MPFAHNPPKLIPFWLAVSSVLVLWDAAYCLLRPRSMPGGDLHAPLWTPYELYGQVDYIYGFKALEDGNGFTSAQSVLNLVETFLNALYLKYWFTGNSDATAVLVGLVSVAMTLSKTVLYWANEYFSDFANIGHNDWSSLLFLWVVPNGAWLVVPGYCFYYFFSEVHNALQNSSGGASQEKVQKVGPYRQTEKLKGF